MPKGNKRGVILFIVIGIIIVVVALATVILRIISNQARLTHHQVSRIQALYAAKAGMVLAFEKLRTGDWSQDPTRINYYCINGPVDASVTCSGASSLGDPLITDSKIHCGNPSIPCNVQIAVCPQALAASPCNTASVNNTIMLKVKTDYTYTSD